MIDVFTCFTDEVEDVDVAVEDIKCGLANMVLAANSVGILHCDSGYVESGVVKAVCGILPFEVVGCTTLSASTNGGMGFILTLTVLTSDDTEFVIGFSPEIDDDDPRKPVDELYEKFAARMERPKMLMVFPPFPRNFGGDAFVRALDACSGGVPIFGALAISNDPDYKYSYTFHNGVHFERSLVLLGLYGDVDPYFFSASIELTDILKQHAIVTGSHRNIVTSINNMPALDYFESVGLTNKQNQGALEGLAMIFSPREGPMLIRFCIDHNPDESIIMTGEVPEGSSLAISAIGPDTIMRSTEEKICEALSVARGRGMLMYSCAARSWTLGIYGMNEHEKAAECIGKASPYHLAYCAGELIPARYGDNSLSNVLQGGSLIICVL
ncbi:MAG: FIST C-terminal domain-containing protein [Synergistaceae bacterium]|jgi:hypothetical protein|nr:FIST C-terminal domain-containing protein [Synergistaceae bacterium]